MCLSLLKALFRNHIEVAASTNCGASVSVFGSGFTSSRIPAVVSMAAGAPCEDLPRWLDVFGVSMSGEQIASKQKAWARRGREVWWDAALVFECADPKIKLAE